LAECGSARGILFDTGAGIEALRAGWPCGISEVEAVFLTHVETEHAGGLREVVARFDVRATFIPRGALLPGRALAARAIGEGEAKTFGGLEVIAFTTPGHAAAHNCYLVQSSSAPMGRGLLISGDLVFAGSAGGGYFNHRQLQENLRRVLGAVPPDTVIAPGHGPLTTVGNELRFNPFVP
jgi:hydroxyacylglutathione hydrolase